MAVYRTIQCSFWDDSFFIDMTPEDKYFYLYLLTNPLSKQCGIYELPYQTMQLHTGYNRETCVKLVKEFVQNGKVLYEESTKELMILNWAKYNWNNSPKVVKKVVEELKRVKHKPFVDRYIAACEEMGYSNEKSWDTLSQLFGYSTDTVSIPYPQEKKREEEVKNKTEQNKTEEGKSADAPTPASVEGSVSSDLWTSCLKKLEEKISRPSFETWFKPTKFESFEDNILVVAVTSEFNLDWLESRYSQLVNQCLTEITKQQITCKFVVRENA